MNWTTTEQKAPRREDRREFGGGDVLISEYERLDGHLWSRAQIGNVYVSSDVPTGDWDEAKKLAMPVLLAKLRAAVAVLEKEAESNG